MLLSPHKLSTKCKLSYFFVYCMTCSLISLLLFLHGFFPIKRSSEDEASATDLPTNILNTSFHLPVPYKRHVGRLVFIVIDAFRWDFIHRGMAYTNLLLKKSEACLLTARCNPPTATMPRIKALMTGSIPNYIDVALNLGNQQVREDNFVHQAVKNGLKVLFYGDETWLQLFPGMFARSEGTTSFVVSDYEEVDLNVTRHIGPELKNFDWDIMFLHFLGLDHIGHMSGPSSHLISPKLEEMDNVIETVHKSMKEWDLHHPNDPSMIVVVGDHGMHDSGSHGGATLGELLVSLVFIGKGCQCTQGSDQEVSQIDVTATLAVLLGLPIPKSNLGILIPQALGRFLPEEYLYALHYNAHQIAQQFVHSNPDGISEDSYHLYLKAQREHVVWLMTDKVDSLSVTKLKALYTSAIENMRRYLVNSLVKFDIMGMGIGCILLVQIFCVLLIYVENAVPINFGGAQKILLLLSLLINLAVFSTLCQYYEGQSILCACKGSTLFVSLVFVLAISFNCWIMTRFLCLSHLKLKIFFHLNATSLFLLVGTILHAISLSSSSFVEEEHQTWYFFWVTFLILLVQSALKLTKNPFYFNILPTMMLLFGHRVLRKLNQTGDKWSSLPDIGDWLNMPEQSMIMSLTAIVSVLCIWYSAMKYTFTLNMIDKILFGMTLMCTLIYRSSTGDITLLSLSNDSAAVHWFWFLWIVIALRSLFQINGHPSAEKMLRTCILLWILVLALLMRPHNLPLLPSILFASATLHKSLQEVRDKTIAHVWLGATWFFYQGNSNSLATIDVAAGYVGVNQQRMIQSGVLVTIHTLNAPVLSTLLLWYGLALQNTTLDRKLNLISRSLYMLLLYKLLPLSAYCAVVLFQRHHLFVWSVFAPKLLYEGALFLCTSILLTCCSIILNFHCFNIFSSRLLPFRAIV